MSSSKNNQKITLGTAIFIAVNAMIGAGVLTMPAQLSLHVGPAGLISCFLSIFLVLCIGLSFGRAAKVYPGEGWSYLYPSKWAGHKVGLFTSFLYLFGVLIAMGVLIQQAGVYCHSIITFIPPLPLGIIILLILMGLVLIGAQASSISQYIIGVCVVLPLLLTGIFCWFNFDIKLVTPFIPYGSMSILNAMPIVLFSLFGFESIASLYGVVKNPDKNVPKVFLISIPFVGLLYILLAYGILFAIPAEYFSGGLNVPLSAVLSEYFLGSKFLSYFVLIGASFAIIGTLHSMLWSLSALLTSTLKRTKSEFFRNIFIDGFWNDKVSAVVTTAIMVVFAIFIDGNILLPMTGLFIVTAYVLSIAALLFVKDEWKSGHNVITLIGLIGGAFMVYFAFKGSIPPLLRLFNLL